MEPTAFDSIPHAGSSNAITSSNEPLLLDSKNAFSPIAYPPFKSIENSPSPSPIQSNLVAASPPRSSVEYAREAPGTPDVFQIKPQDSSVSQYHSDIYTLLSWKNSRASALAFTVNVSFILAARYLNIFRYIFKVLYLVLGTSVAAELVGKLVLGQGLASKVRPKNYFVIPKYYLQRTLDDISEMINFFVIEFQHMLFVKNIYLTLVGFLVSVVGYWLIKYLPLWGLMLLANVLAFMGPLTYIQNKEVIDESLEYAVEYINEGANQAKLLAAERTKQASASIRTFTRAYTPEITRHLTPTKTTPKKEFPSPPAHEPSPRLYTVLDLMENPPAANEKVALTDPAPI